MISKATMMIGIIAVLVAFVAAYGFRVMLVKDETTTTPEKVVQEEVFKVPLAATNLPADRAVVAQDAYVSSMTKVQFEKQFPKVNLDEVYASMRSVVNRRLAKPVKKGQPFLTTDFYLMGTGPSVATKLQPGYRAVRVQVPNTREAGVQTGMFVDVFFRATARPAKAGQPAIPEKTLTLLRHIEVLNAERPEARSTGTNIMGMPAKPMLFTLAVPEDKVDMFGVIEGRGELWLVPTPTKDADNPNGSQATVADASTLAELLGIKPHQPASPPFETEIYERGNRKVNVFVDGRLAVHQTNVLRTRMMSEAQLPSSGAAESAPSPANNTLPTAPPAPEKD